MKFSRYNLVLKNEEETLLVNTFSGALYKISDIEKRSIELKVMDDLPEEIIQDYYNKGILIDDEVDERRILKYFHNKEKFNTKVLSLTILLTMECNFQCVYCFEGSKTLQKIYLEQRCMENIYKFIEHLLIEDLNIEMVHITLFGGEPLLNLKNCSTWLYRIKELCNIKNKRFVTGVITNGSLLSDEILDILSMCNCNTIQITVDGTEKVHNERRFYADGRGTFQDIIAAIKLVIDRENVPNPVIRINIDKSNLISAEMLLEYLAQENLIECQVDFGIVRAGNEENKEYVSQCFVEEELEEIYGRLLEKKKLLGFAVDFQPSRRSLGCGLYNDKAFTIAPDGQVYKCWEYVGNEKFCIGNIGSQGSFEKLYFHYFDWMTKEFSENQVCNNCVYLPVCGGGCAAVSYENNTHIHSNGCHKVKGLFEAKVKYNYIHKNHNEK